MSVARSEHRKSRFLIRGLLGLVAVVVGGLGLSIYETYKTHQDYNQLASCLEKHDLAVKDGWKYTDQGPLEIFGYARLENFGLTFATASGQLWTVEVIDGQGVRNCNDSIDQLNLAGRTLGLPNGTVLQLDHPDLQESLTGPPIQTMDDLLSQLEQILPLVQQRPGAFVASLDTVVSKGRVMIYEPGNWQP